MAGAPYVLVQPDRQSDPRSIDQAHYEELSTPGHRNPNSLIEEEMNEKEMKNADGHVYHL